MCQCCYGSIIILRKARRQEELIQIHVGMCVWPLWASVYLHVVMEFHLTAQTEYPRTTHYTLYCIIKVVWNNTEKKNVWKEQRTCN